MQRNLHPSDPKHCRRNLRSGRAMALMLLWVCVSLFSTRLSAQILPLADQYQMNLFQLNPATAGVVTLDPLVLNVSKTAGAWDQVNAKPPTTASLTFQSKLFKEKSYYNKRGFLNRGKNAYGKVGLGLGLFDYSYGPVSHTGLHLDYAYHVFLSNGRLSFGLAPVFTIFGANLSDWNLIFNQNPDDVWGTGKDPLKMYFLDFNAGVHYYSDRLTAGFSTIQMLDGTLYFAGEYGMPNKQEPITNPDLTRTFYGYTGYAFDIHPNGRLRLEPFLMLRYNTHSASPLRVDLTTTFYLDDQFQTGLTYKLNEGGAAFFGLRYNKFHIRYQFGFPINKTLPVSFTTHTVQVGFDPGFRLN